jgi:two-component system, cell cycle response regulator DivK
MLLRNKHIYIVEDDSRNRAVMLTILQQNGAKTSFDQWGQQTLERIKSHDKIDLILMDLMLPRGVTGYDVFAQLQADKELAGIPAVVVSASDPAIEMNKARKLGFRGYISKPIQYQSFAQVIATILEGQPVWMDE